MPSPLSILSRVSSAQSDVSDTRERLAVVLKQGLSAYDAYVAAQPWIFGAGILAMGVSGVLLWKRRRNPEAYALYITTFVLGAAAAWFAKPWDSAAAPATAKQAGGPTIIDRLDAKRREYAAEDPRWADKTWSRVAAMPGVGDQINKQPLLKALVGA
jgi:LPXTG-motif cell wall-anchored protein